MLSAGQWPAALAWSWQVLLCSLQQTMLHAQTFSGGCMRLCGLLAVHPQDACCAHLHWSRQPVPYRHSNQHAECTSTS